MIVIVYVCSACQVQINSHFLVQLNNSCVLHVCKVRYVEDITFVFKVEMNFELV